MAENPTASFCCPHCGNSFRCGKALGGHISSAHVQPKKNLLEEGKESYTCPDPKCTKKDTIYSSSKALHGHMRAHRDRNYRGMTPPKFYKNIDSEVSRVSKVLYKKNKPVIFSNVSETGKIVEFSDLMRVEEGKVGDIVGFSCIVCDKTFSTHQALGGHVASHKQRTMKIYNTADDPRFDASRKRKLSSVESNLGSSKVQSTQLDSPTSPVFVPSH